MIFLVAKIHSAADVSSDAHIGPGTVIWHLAQVREGAELGPDCIVGRGAYIGSGVTVGKNSKIQNYALVYEPAVLGDGVFIGPGAVLTNDTYPRAVTSTGDLKSSADWQASGVIIGDGASVGAHATCVAPLTVGEWAVIAAGAVVTKNVPPYALVAGVPAKQIGWVGPAGRRLVESQGALTCPVTKQTFQEVDGCLIEVESHG